MAGQLVLQGDFWGRLGPFPAGLERMVALAEAHPSVGVVGAYGLEGSQVVWTGLPYPGEVIPGRDAYRRYLLGGSYVFGTATSVLYRADLVRGHDPFYNEDNVHADMRACALLLKTSDFGFVHQILTVTRVRPESLSALSRDINTISPWKLADPGDARPPLPDRRGSRTAWTGRCPITTDSSAEARNCRPLGEKLLGISQAKFDRCGRRLQPEPF